MNRTMSGRRLRESVKQVRWSSNPRTHMPMHIESHQQGLKRPCLCVCQELQSEGAFRDVEVVIAGLSNVYTHYITTFEEYQVHTAMTYQSVIHRDANSTMWPVTFQVQRYEGASTIFGPHTLSAYLQKYRGLARAIAQAGLTLLA